MTVSEVYTAEIAKVAPATDIGHFLPYLRSVAKGNILEIGVRRGASTSAFLLGVKENGGHVTSVDIEDCSRVFDPIPTWWTFIQANSQGSGRIFPALPGLLDVLFIDGDHTRDGYQADLCTYHAIVRPGGLIISHDIACEPNKNIEDLGPVAGKGWPSKAIREVYFKFAGDHGYEHVELSGMYGLGIMQVRP